MAAGDAAAQSSTGTIRSLQQTPTWAVAIVCLVFISISILIEHSIHLISKVGLLLDFSEFRQTIYIDYS